jgi:monofunctional biosynthetic peptidoglycan transglycosylase
MLTRLFLLLLVCIALLLMPVILLKWLPPPTTAFMLQSPVKPVRYNWVPANRIAEVARRAVIAAEDQKFRTHNGFDVEAIEKAYAHNRKARRKRGASTISQQTAKNLFLWPGGGYFRKGVEAGFTVLLENIWGKDRILEVYLNIAEFGPGIYGVEAASQAYFHKPAAQLSAGEAARLAAVLPNPRHWSVTAPGAFVQARSNWIVGQMGYGHRDVPAEEPEPPAGESDAGDMDPALPVGKSAAPATSPVPDATSSSNATTPEPAQPQAPQPP